MSENLHASFPHKVDGALEQVEGFQSFLVRTLGASPHTVGAYGRDLRECLRWLEQQGLSWEQPQLEALRRYLFFEKVWKASTIARKLSAFRAFVHYLNETPAASAWKLGLQGLKPPKSPLKVPRRLSEQEVERLLQSPKLSSWLARRDQTMLEVLYATGCRVGELIALKKGDFFPHEGLLKLLGKGGHERWVPLHQTAILALQNYLQVDRGRASSQAPLFTSAYGAQKLTRQAVWKRLKGLAKAAGFPLASITPHALRHAFATHLMDRGADLRVVQTLLGHRQLATTQIYTHVAKGKLQALHRRFHLRERGEAQEGDSEQSERF